MRKNVTKVVAALLSAALVVTSVTVPGSTSKAAAKTLKLTVKSGTTKKKPAKQTLWLNAAAKEKKVTLTAKGVKKVTWKSSKKSVATVKKNVVTAKKAGTAYITAKSGKKQFTVKITVNKAATGVTLGKTGDMKVGATKTVKIGYKGSPNKAGKSVTVKVKGSAVKATVKSATKLEVKALKKGSATVTITSKKSKKTAKITVKVTEKAAATAAPSASAAPASQAPAESAAPTASADASAAPSADVSAAPGESTAPSAEPSRDPSVVTEIKLLNDTALTNEDSTEAYVYYDVLDQYGESMRSKADIQWTTSPNTKKVDKSIGKITITTTENDKFTYGKDLYVTGVHATTGVKVSSNVKVGLKQAPDTIVFGGFVNEKNATKLVDEKEIDHLPANFAMNEYWMLFQVKDQNGNLMDVTQVKDGVASVMTFISDKPLLMVFPTMKGNDLKKTFTIAGTDYAAVRVNPAKYVDQGGEVGVTVIGNTYGGKTPVNIKIGELPQLQSIELSQPTDTVADGDTWVKIPYVAKTTKGTETKDYETIVRSSNSLQLSVSDGELFVKEENDGTAGFYWSDSAKYSRTYSTGDNCGYSQSGVADGIQRQVSLTTVVIGGTSNNFVLKVDDIRIPTDIVKVKRGSNELGDYLANRDSVSVNVSDFVYKDQYGKELLSGEASAFFAYTKNTPFGNSANKGIYGVRIDGDTTGRMIQESNSLIQEKGDTVLQSGDLVTIQGKLTDDGKVHAESMKFTVVKVNNDDQNRKAAEKMSSVSGSAFALNPTAYPDRAKPDQWDDTGKALQKSMTSVPVMSLKNPAITGLDNKIQLVNVDGTDVNANANEAKIKAGSIVNTTFKVATGNYDNAKWGAAGKYNGNVVIIPSLYFNIGSASDSAFEINKSEYLREFIKTDARYSDFFDAQAFGYPAKDASFDFVLVLKDDSLHVTTTKLVKSVKVSMAARGVASLKFVGGDTVNPTSGGVFGVPVKASTVLGNVPTYEVYDNYGSVMSNVDVIFTISDYAENTGDYAHVLDSFAIESNSTTAAGVTMAEIGDSYKLTATVKGSTISDSCTVKVGADTLAKISSNDTNSTDKAFREGYLGYVAQ